MKGLSIRKSSVPRKLRKAFTNILQEDILRVDKINVKSILNKYDALEKEIRQSLSNGEIEYTLPRALQLPDTYKNPERIEGLRGALIWNALESDNQLSLPDKSNMVKLLPIEEPDDPRLDWLKENYPDKYKKVMETVFNIGKENKIDISKFGFSCVSFPKSVTKIPPYLVHYIDYQAMIANNMSNGYILLESLGVNTETVGTTNYKTNIIEI